MTYIVVAKRSFVVIKTIREIICSGAKLLIEKIIRFDSHQI